MDSFFVHEEIVARKFVVEARNELARRIVALDPEKTMPRVSWSPFVLWVDDDAWWPRGSVARAFEIMLSNPDISVLCGYFCKRDTFAPPVALSESGVSPKLQASPAEPFKILLCGFHWVMMRREVLEVVGDDPFSLLEEALYPVDSGIPFYAEDFSFCRRVIEAGLQIYCATDIPIAHVEPIQGYVFYPNVQRFTMRDFWPERDTTGTTDLSEDRTYGEDVEACFSRRIKAIEADAALLEQKDRESDSAA
jgi:hypothetical protein